MGAGRKAGLCRYDVQANGSCHIGKAALTSRREDCHEVWQQLGCADLHAPAMPSVVNWDLQKFASGYLLVAGTAGLKSRHLHASPHLSMAGKIICASRLAKLSNLDQRQDVGAAASTTQQPQTQNKPAP